MSWAEENPPEDNEVDEVYEEKENTMQITIAAIETGKYPKIVATNKMKFSVGDANAFESGKTYDVTYSEKDVEWQGKTFKSKTITGAKLAVPVATAPTANGNGNGKQDYGASEAMKTVYNRELWMARMAALKASVEMAKAEAELVPKGGTLGLGAINVSEVQKRYYAEFLAEITK